MPNAFFRDNVRRIAFFAGCATLIIIIGASLSPIEYRPSSGFAVNPEREFAFASMGLAFVVGRPSRPLLLLVLLLAVAGGLEMMQELVPTRHGRIEDFLVKSLGLAAGVAIGAIANALARRKVFRSEP